MLNNALIRLLEKIIKVLSSEKNNKKKEEQVFRYHPGTYNFYIPFTGSYPFFITENNMSVPLCKVEMHVGNQRDHENGHIAVIIIHSNNDGYGNNTFIEDITTNIRRCMFGMVFNEDYSKEAHPYLETIKWIQHSPAGISTFHPKERWTTVKLDWDSNNKAYVNPEWSTYSGYYSQVKSALQVSEGFVYKVDISMSNFPKLGEIHNVVIIEHYENIEQVLIAPIAAYSSSIFNLGEPIKVGSNILGIDKDYVLRVDKIKLIEKSELLEKVGRLPEKKTAEIIDYCKTHINQYSLSSSNLIYKEKFIINQSISLEENEYTEFKSINSGKPAKQIADLFEQYVCAFLNGKGGRILFGITDDRIIQGVKLNVNQRDELNQLVNLKITQIEPRLDPTSIISKLHNVYENNECISDLFILEVLIPRSYSKEVYFTGKSEVWVKLKGVKQKLQKKALVDWIVNNQIGRS